MQFRRYRKLFFVLVSVWLVLVSLGLLFSHSMQEKVIQILSRKADKYLLSEIHINKNDIRFSVFRRFPQASIELRNITVMLPSGFQKQNSISPKGDTLLHAKKIFLQLDILSLFTDNYELEKIEVYDGFLQILSDKQGNSSLEIIRKSSEKSPKSIAANIRSIQINEVTIYNTDFNSKTVFQAHVSKAGISGSFSAEKFSAKIKSAGILQKIEINGQKLDPFQSFETDIHLKYSKQSYIIEKGAFRFANIPFKVIGSLKMGEKPLLDLIFSARDVSVKQIDKAIFSSLMGENGFEPRGGDLSIQASIIGQINRGMPTIKAGFRLTNGKFLDKKHNLMLNDIFVEGNADNGRERLPRSTTIRLDTLSFRTDNSYQHGKLKIQNLIEPDVALSLNGQIDVNDLLLLVAIPNISLKSGKIANATLITGKLNKRALSGTELLNSIEVQGSFRLEDLTLDFLKYKLATTHLDGQIDLLDKNTIRFNGLKAVNANSNISFKGVLQNFLKKDEIPTYLGDIYSSNFVVDDFIQQGSSNSSPIVFPDSILINGTLSIESFTYANFKSSDFNCQIDYRNKKLKADMLRMNGFEGNLQGNLDLSQLASGNIHLLSNGTLNHVNIKQLFVGCKNFAQDIIGAEHLEGYISGDFMVSSEWTSALEFIPSTVAGQGNMNLTKGSIKNYEPLLGLSDFINVEELKNIRFDNLNTSITVRNEKVYLDQTNINSSAISFVGSGVHGFDNSYEYRLQLGLSDILWGKAKKKRTEITEFGYVVDDGVGHTTVPLTIKGKGTEFEVNYDKRTARSEFKEKLMQEKTDLWELFKKSNQPTESGKPEEHGLIIETEEQQQQQQKPEKTSERTTEKKSTEFEIEWDDSDDE